MIILVAAFVVFATVASAQTSNDDALILEGDLVTMSARGVLIDARLWLRNGRIAGVFETDAALAEAVDTGDIPRLRTNAWVFPGFINLHTHMPFNHEPLWAADKKFENRYQWQAYPALERAVMMPQRILYGSEEYNLGNEQTLFAEARALIGGTTALTSSAVPGYYTRVGNLVRNLEYEPPDSGRVEAHVAEVDEEFIEREAGRLRMDFDSGELRAWVAHIAEGIDQRSRDEFERLRRAGLVRREVVIVHGTGLDENQLRDLGKVGGHLVWAPTSNYLLYGEMADVETAARSGVTISLSNDWAPSGTHNLLAELKVAAAAYERRYGSALSSKTLIEMITVNPAKAIGWDERAGKLVTGVYADVVVIGKRSGFDPYDTLVRATERDIELVIVGGEPAYGRSDWMERFKPGDSEVLQATGADGATYVKRIDVTRSPGDMTLSRARARLRRALSFDEDAMLELFLDATGKPMTREALARYLDDNYRGLTQQLLPPIFLSNDEEFFERLRRLQFPFTSALARAYRP